MKTGIIRKNIQFRTFLIDKKVMNEASGGNEVVKVYCQAFPNTHSTSNR